ncbi:thiolester hydrolase [Trypanosoma rangeli]|uniref:Thiolester hydrolase n=1 Tax=Trypanosoma rangeli TaxID=5698 RepID=A0A3R7M5A1_TRYRA|nr:thiolester hydrolase [Trypanosoma rangeli]RNE99683.1 thiolester hydrolase [Trypanosoma rangeli]|eukprot:RNE99683.1 thiolester hydrolase [Trypanosoma rangeli]
MFKVDSDGSAITYHIPVNPFVPLQHTKIDVTTVNHLANFGVRFAMEHGWCYCRPRSNRAQGASEAVDEGYVEPGGDVTVFFAGVEAQLTGEMPKFDGKITPASLFFWGQFWVSHVGNSSFGIYGRLFHYDATDEAKKVPIGVFKLTGVTVSKVSRKPVPIPKERAAMLLETMQRHQLTVTLPRAVRIDLAGFLARSGVFTDETCCKTVNPLPTHASAAPLQVAYRREFHIRHSDIDFNGHVNQMALIQLVINAFRSALADQTTIFPRLLDAGVNAIVGDLLLRRLHIDYVRETPMDHRSVIVTLFFIDDVSRDAVIASSAESRGKTMADLGFLAQGVLTDGAPPHIAAIGVLCICC